MDHRSFRTGHDPADLLCFAKGALDEKRHGISGGLARRVVAFVVEHLFSLDRLWWIFNGVASCFVVQTVLSLYYDRLSAKGVVTGICGALLGMVAFVYGNWVQNDVITVFSALFIVVVSLVCCIGFHRAKPWMSEW